MDNICFLGLAFIGLLILTKKSNKKKTIMDIPETITESDETFVNSGNSEIEIAKQLAQNKYMNKIEDGIEWIIPVNEVLNNDLHPFIGLDYLKMSINIDYEKTIGRYMNVDENTKDIFKIIIPSLEYGTEIQTDTGILTLVKNTNVSIGVSVITLNFVENINTHLTICELKKIYKKVIKNYTCKNKIEPVIEWFNTDLLNESTTLYSDLCETDQTSALETEQVLDTNLLDETDTSIDDIDSETSLEDLEYVEDSETSVDNLEDVEDVEDVEEDVMDDISETSINAENLDNITDSDTSEIIDSINSEIEDLTQKKTKYNKKLNMLEDGSMNDINVDDLSVTSEDTKTKPKKSSTKKKTKKNASSTKKKKTKKKASGTKKKKSNKKTSGGKKKKSNKINLNSEDLEISGGSSSSVTNTRKSILGRF